MPSASLTNWQRDRLPRLGEIARQCAAVASSLPPDPRLVEDNLRAYILLLSAQMQGFCRDLYSECGQAIVAKVRPSLRMVIQEQFTAQRALDHGNPNIENLKKDFERFGFTLNLAAYDPANHARLADLKAMNRWRNIVAHDGEVPPTGVPTLAAIEGWRISCTGLATSMDEVVYNRLRRILRRRPW